MNFEYDDSDEGDAYLPINESCNNYEVEEYKYEVLSPNEIFNLMNNEIEKTISLMEVPHITGRLLLSHFKWDREKLINRYFDEKTKNIFIEANIPNPKSFAKLKFNDNEEFDCEICFSCCKFKEMSCLDCNHKFCNDCYAYYVKDKILVEGIADSIPCPFPKCPLKVDDKMVLKLVVDDVAKVKYKHLITNSFVQCNRLMRFCPSPNCSYAIKVIYIDRYPIRCKCDYVFCFDCGGDNHAPVSCNILKKWKKKCSEDTESYKWLDTHTKPCPNCNTNIEKNGGCNHMTCTNPNCRHEFCWVCMTKWQSHRSCNTFVEEARTKKIAEKAQSLDRYVHFYQRYTNHMNSYNLEKNLYSTAAIKMDELQNLGMLWVEVQFMKKAVEILRSCRLTLKYSYVFAFYLDKNNQTIIFEDNQKDLERATEELSRYLEREIDTSKIDVKQQVQDKLIYCEKRQKALLNHVQEGYEKLWWKFSVD